MKKVFISQLMKDKTDEEIITKRQELFELLQERFPETEFQLLPSYLNLEEEDEAPYCVPVNNLSIWYLARSISFLSCADIVILEKEYWKGRGTRVEHEICEIYGLKHFHEWELRDERILQEASKTEQWI